jgi:hypothetical protein
MMVTHSLYTLNDSNLAWFQETIIPATWISSISVSWVLFRHKYSILLSKLSEYIPGTIEDASHDLDLDDDQMDYDE